MPGIAEFEGDWTVEKRIEDRRAGEVLELRGVVRFVADGDVWRVEETGQLIAPGRPALETRRVYLWRAAGPEIEVLFEDGRPFHSFLPEGQPQARHDCAPDLYRVSYDFAGWPEWHATWTVSGPRKDYTMAATHRR
ncbi:MAG: trigger factor [Rhodobacteraceae bacterium]|nr:trigger factor [Paracoccaceae bacterium]